ncbi:hypothetical protein [Natronorarus salvus]|uniref:hypothetical protein n=1 Tax=Natronorarus salvus TaxID=3117733 RepID=UPI002F266AF8
MEAPDTADLALSGVLSLAIALLGTWLVTAREIPGTEGLSPVTVGLVLFVGAFAGLVVVRYGMALDAGP